MVWAKREKRKKKKRGGGSYSWGREIESKRKGERLACKLDTGMRAGRKHREAYLTSSPYFSSWGISLVKMQHSLLPLDDLEMDSLGVTRVELVFFLLQTIDWGRKSNGGRSHCTWPSYIRVHTEDEMEWFPFQPTIRSLEDVFIFLAPFSSQLQPYMKSFHCWKLGLLLSHGIYKCCFLYPECLVPTFTTLSQGILLFFSDSLSTYSIITINFGEGLGPVIPSPGPTIRDA